MKNIRNLLIVSTLALSLLSLSAIAADTKAQSPEKVIMAPTTAQVVEKFGDKLDQYMTALASKAGVAADHFYPIFVKQQFIEGMTDLFTTVGFVVVMIWLFVIGYKNNVKYIDREDRDNMAEAKMWFGYILGSIMAVVLVIGMLSGMPTVMGKIFNPEYYAVKSLVEMVK